MSWQLFVFVFIGTVWAQDLSHDIDVNFIKSRALEPDAEIRPAAVKRFFGVQDSKAVIGRLFSYRIPQDAFEGDVKSFHFPNHPPWLTWNAKEKILEGVPTSIDEGHSYVTVVAQGASSNAKDLFEISVIPPSEKMLLKESSCKDNHEVTVMSVIVDSSISSLKPRKRVKLIHKLSKLLNISPQLLSLSSPESDITGANIELIKKRKNKHLKHEDMLSIEVIVGCNGEISKKNQDLVEAMTKVASTGKLERVLGHKIIGWHVAKKNTNSKLVKRQANEDEYEYSGDGDYNDYEGYDDDAYDYDYDNFFKNNKVIENTPDVTSTEVAAPAEVPTIAPTATFPPTNPTQTYIPGKPTRVIDASPSTLLPSIPPTDRSRDHLESSMSIYPTEIIDNTTPLMNMTKYPDISRPYPPVESTAVPDFGGNVVTNNFPPFIKERIPKFSWTTGRVYKVLVPEDAFGDHEDGTTRDLTLMLKDERGRALNYNSWIQIDQLNQIIYALPLEKQISTYEMTLEAVDKGGKSAEDNLSIRLSQPKESRNIHHEYTVSLKSDKMYHSELLHGLDWQILAVEKIATVFGGRVEDINVRNISSDSMLHITWTNITLVDSESRLCPVEQLENQAKMLIEKDKMPTAMAVEIFEPQFRLESASVEYLKKCAHLNQNYNMNVKSENTPPMFRNPIDSLTAYQGKVFRFQVPEDTCYDFEDGPNSKMRLLTGDLDTLPPTYWLQFDESNNEFYGLPLSDDTQNRNYVLECLDSGEQKASDSMEINVMPTAYQLEPAQFSLTINTDYNSFMSDVKTKVDFVEKLAMAFGDSNPNAITIDRFDSGSVKVIWHNNTLDTKVCPNETLNQLRAVMADEDGKMKDSFKSAFEPYFEITDVSVVAGGVCLSPKTPQHKEEPDVETSSNADASEADKTPGKEDYLLTFIIPGVLIAVMIILAVIIAFCLWRRRRYAKMSLADDKTFVPNKGYPIIFAEELDDHNKSDRANNPVIMKQEKGPLPPPEYQRHSPGITGTPPRERSSLPPVDHAPYQPPMPPYGSANGTNRNSRPNMPPVYKKPPTYVPP